MQPPRKPWENGPINNYSSNVNSFTRNMIPGASPVLHSSSPSIPIQRLTTPVGNVSTMQQPPPPPRRVVSNPNSMQSTAYRQSYIPGSSTLGYGSPYNSLGYGGYGGYGSYGSYGGYSGLGLNYGSYGGYGSYGSYGMNRYGAPNPNDPESRFIQLAEESSRPAFQSIESLVQAFHSVSMMLDSTFNAVHTSFRAVLGVAENFGRLRTLFAQFFSSIALFRAVMWLFKKVLYVLGLRHDNPGSDTLWQQAVQATGEDLATSAGRPRSSWPILMFMGIVFSGPYLIFKLMSSISRTPDATEAAPRSGLWDPEQTPGSPAVALYDFFARNEDELSFQAGQRILVAPSSVQRKELNGWILAKVDGSSQVGLVPYNYIAPVAAVKKNFEADKCPSATDQHKVSDTPKLTDLQSGCADNVSSQPLNISDTSDKPKPSSMTSLSTSSLDKIQEEET